jgi:hypothetical protein
MKFKPLYTLISIMPLLTAGCWEEGASTSSPVCGIYSLHTSDSSIHHGVDILVINKDSTYTHFYTKGSSGKDLVQNGTWKTYGGSIDFSGFVGGDLGGPDQQGVMFPDPAVTGLPLSNFGGVHEIDANPDRGQKFIQIEKCE